MSRAIPYLLVLLVVCSLCLEVAEQHIAQHAHITLGQATTLRWIKHIVKLKAKVLVHLQAWS